MQLQIVVQTLFTYLSHDSKISSLNMINQKCMCPVYNIIILVN